ncbi:hypothetical protein [Burkholderia gladioli]|uniref:hypothetical protein n=1 Tax=Burkholderia gladioli TaxID=28095 RepID=UPI001641C1C5|nr:hypothetical protein [Burkholderia gladioli]
MAVPFEIYAHFSGNAEKYSFRESDLKDGVMGPKRRHIGTLYAPGEPGEKFALMPRNGKEPMNAIESAPLELAVQHCPEPGKKRAWSADEAVAKAQGDQKDDEPIFIFTPVQP